MAAPVGLITYASRLGGDLRRLREIMAGPLAGLFGGIHVLPFYTPFDGADPRVPHWPRSSGHARPPASAVRGSRRTAVGLSLAGLSLVRPVPVVRSSLAESRQRRPLLAAGVTLGVHMSGMSRPGPAGYPIVRDR